MSALYNLHNESPPMFLKDGSLCKTLRRTFATHVMNVPLYQGESFSNPRHEHSLLNLRTRALPPPGGLLNRS